MNLFRKKKKNKKKDEFNLPTMDEIVRDTCKDL